MPARTCTACRYVMADDENFCPRCGTPAGGGATPEVASASPSATPSGAVNAGDVVGHQADVQPRPAGFWIRVAAAIVDVIVVAIGVIVIKISAGILGAAAGISEKATADLADVAILVLYYAYFIVLEASSQQATLGKQALGIKVVGRDGGRISLGRSVGRNAAQILSYVLLLVGYIMVAFTRRKQGLHDMMASTYVVHD